MRKQHKLSIYPYSLTHARHHTPSPGPIFHPDNIIMKWMFCAQNRNEICSTCKVLCVMRRTYYSILSCIMHMDAAFGHSQEILLLLLLVCCAVHHHRIGFRISWQCVKGDFWIRFTIFHAAAQHRRRRQQHSFHSNFHQSTAPSDFIPIVRRIAHTHNAILHIISTE